jgi:type I restriction enzyme R subunit
LNSSKARMARILILQTKLKDGKDKEKKQKEIVDLIAGETQLRSKWELIERCIKENLAAIEDADNIPDEFEKYWNKEHLAAFQKLCAEESLSDAKVEKVIANYLFSEPLRDEVLDLIEGAKPSVLERKNTGNRIKDPSKANYFIIGYF